MGCRVQWGRTNHGLGKDGRLVQNTKTCPTPLSNIINIAVINIAQLVIPGFLILTLEKSAPMEMIM